jgi:hemoglobin
MSEKPTPTLCEWAGVVQRIEQLFRTFYERVPLDPVLAPVFVDMPAEHFQTVAHFVV